MKNRITGLSSVFGRNAHTLLAAILYFAAIHFLAGCASPPLHQPPTSALVSGTPPPGISAAHSPLFLISDYNLLYNRIGTPSAMSGEDDELEIIVSPAQPTIYYTKSSFSTETATYSNLVYRIHFPEVPFAWPDINLTAGKNPGILIIYTLSEESELLLVTTVHSCGCYLAFLPTHAMPRSAYPNGWPAETQDIYGETLPARVAVPQDYLSQRIIFSLRNETHRISDVSTVQDWPDLSDILIEADSRPVEELYNLPFRDRTVSFFELSGSREGYVRNNTKWLEKIFIGWWAFDFRVGEDKAFGGPDTSSIPLYTSLKFWAREESDLKNFPRFLKYWGWKL